MIAKWNRAHKIYEDLKMLKWIISKVFDSSKKFEEKCMHAFIHFNVNWAISALASIKKSKSYYLKNKKNEMKKSRKTMSVPHSYTILFVSC